MSINNQKGAVKSSVSLSIAIHVGIVGLLLFSPQIKKLPIVKDLIGARTSTDMSIKGSIGKDSEEVTVAYIEPEKNSIKKLNSAKDSIKIQEDSPVEVEEKDVPSVPEKRIVKSKVKKLLAKSDVTPEKKNTPETDSLSDANSKIEPEEELDDINDEIAEENTTMITMKS